MSNGPAIVSSKPLLPSNTCRGPVMPLRGEQSGMGRRHRRIGIGEALPMRQRAGARDAQRIVGGSADGDRVGDLVRESRSALATPAAAA